jgi:endonuclease
VRAEAFALWMRPQYTESSAENRVSRVRRVEAVYGDLDALYDKDRLASLISELTYSTRDQQQKRLNPTRIIMNGELHKGLASLKNAVARYREFRDNDSGSETVAEAAIEIASESIREKREGRQFEIERHLQDSLRLEIEQLEDGLIVIDGGDERSVESGFIDILGKDQNGALVVIELKSGTAKREAIGQIVGYMGDLIAEEPEIQVRGILVAADFDKSCQSGVRAIPSLKLKRYRFSFTFEEV